MNTNLAKFEQMARGGKPTTEVEPIYRCHNCQSLLLFAKLQEEGSCPKCGGRRIRSVCHLTESEHKQAVEWGVPQAFFDQFTEVNV